MPGIVGGIALDAQRVEEVIDGNDFLTIVLESLTAEMDLDSRLLCRDCAAALHLMDFYSSAAVAVMQSSGKVGLDEKKLRRLQEREVRRQRSVAVDRLQSAGVLPSGLLWLVVRFVVLPFLTQLLTAFIFGQYNGCCS